MAHEIARINNTDSVYTGRNIVAWHRLGKTINGLATWQEAIKYANLNWPVEKQDLYDKTGKPVAHGMFRKDTSDIFLGTVGERYTPIQNEDMFRFVDYLVGAGEAIYDTAGALGNGENVFCTVHLPSAGYNVRGDKHESYLLFRSSHDGSVSAQTLLTDVRVVCQNTLNMALNAGKNIIKIKHTTNSQEKLKQVKSLMGNTIKTLEGLQERMTFLSDKEPTNKNLRSIFNTLYTEDEGGLSTKAKNSIEAILELYNHNEKSAYGLFNAFTEYVDHVRSTKGDVLIGRAESALFGSGNKVKTDILGIIMSEASNMKYRFGAEVN